MKKITKTSLKAALIISLVIAIGTLLLSMLFDEFKGNGVSNLVIVFFIVLSICLMASAFLVLPKKNALIADAIIAVMALIIAGSIISIGKISFAPLNASIGIFLFVLLLFLSVFVGFLNTPVLFIFRALGIEGFGENTSYILFALANFIFYFIITFVITQIILMIRKRRIKKR